jgi:hypothetical protein
VETGFEPVYTDLQSVASPLGHSTGEPLPTGTGRDSLRADDGIRTRDPHLGKVMLYQLSHVRASCNQAARVRSETIAEAMAGVQTCSQTAPGSDANQRTMITADR